MTIWTDLESDREAEWSPEFGMRLALEEAMRGARLGEVPIGAVVMQGDEVLSRAHNFRETWRDPTAHAELIALRQAALRKGGWRLFDCQMYVTLEPCAMCAGAILQARIDHLYYGAVDTKGGAIVSQVQLYQSPGWNHHPAVTGGILAEECGIVLKNFFQEVRQTMRPRRDV
ncbi:MAG: tRNA adenosine(34) deaminase TadA [Alicyclobacillaceae bacterium]|nr:tRNA adenosine(34) deaminase TadA [Alicyclobacillaceae bacterium]MCY0896087.1 tRNA adenosine(34) deaminase TadA [Alicyclobacillaceae bacterium]